MFSLWKSVLRLRKISQAESQFLTIKPIHQHSRPEVFCKKSVLKKFTNLTGKNLCWSIFLKNMQAYMQALGPQLN